ncbi:N-terminal part of molybdate metabolism regulator MolR-like protein [Escherichia coli]|nr:N-terminal part of molybdate metabolism regulator MolR-like protein [Escherichia coli]SQM10824.1 N-terminal part of molybdate metabolism regulator MolR-like protein [Escherichia coli]SQM25750.1 N-terminal part of molybdate metabolism regulator MolR-like protein [Escherichia coli]
MDKELPWLADNAQLELKYKKGKTPLSHRNWPGEPVPVITESIIQTLGDELLQKAEKKKNIVWRYENFSLEWQSAITQAINLIGEHKPSVPARTMAVLACIAQKDSQQLLDEIVQQEGLEYATEVVIARQFIARCYENDRKHPVKAHCRPS